MTGIANPAEVIHARRAKVLEYVGQGFSQASMAKILGVGERTIARDVVAVMDEIRSQRTQIRKDFVEQRIAGHRKRSDMIAVELEKSKGDPHNYQRWLKLQQDEDALFTKWMQEFGDAPKVADRIEQQVQVTENPLFGLYDDSEDNQSEPDSGTKDES